MMHAQREAARAVELDPGLSGAWRVLAYVSHYRDWHHADAERLFRKSVAVNPNDAVAWTWFAETLMDLGRFDEASEYIRRAQDASPRWLGAIAVAGNIHLFTGHATLALAEYQRALDIEPNYGLGNHFTGRAYLALARNADAITQLRKSNELLGVPFAVGDLGYALAVGGQRAEAERLAADLKTRRASGYFPAFPLAEIAVGLGRLDEALDCSSAPATNAISATTPRASTSCTSRCGPRAASVR